MSEGKSITSWSGVSRNSILIALGVVVSVGVGGAVYSKDNSAVIIGFCSMICVSLFTELRRIQNDAEQARNVEEVKEALGVSDQKVEEVKKTLVVEQSKTAEQLTSIARVSDDTHTLVNNNMAVQLNLNMELSRWKADQTKAPADIAAADRAKKIYDEHMVKQGRVDAAKSARPAPEQHAPVPVTIVETEKPLDVRIKPHG